MRSVSLLSIASFNAMTAARSSPRAQSARLFRSLNPLARSQPPARWILHAAFNPSTIIASSSSFLACDW